MKSSLVFIVLFSILLFASSVAARKDTGGYWKAVTKDQAMPEAIQPLVHVHPITSLSTIKDFEPNPRLWIYDDGVKSTKDESFAKHFEPKSRFWIYDNGVKSTKTQSFDKDFEPRPNVSNYQDDALKGKESFAEDFEPRPNVSVYDNGADKNSFPRDFEPKPSATASQ